MTQPEEVSTPTEEVIKKLDFAKEILQVQLAIFSIPKESGWGTAPSILLEVRVPLSVQKWMEELAGTIPEFNLSEYWTTALSDLITEGIGAKLKKGSW